MIQSRLCGWEVSFLSRTQPAAVPRIGVHRPCNTIVAIALSRSPSYPVLDGLLGLGMFVLVLQCNRQLHTTARSNALQRRQGKISHMASLKLSVKVILGCAGAVFLPRARAAVVTPPSAVPVTLRTCPPVQLGPGTGCRRLPCAPGSAPPKLNGTGKSSACNLDMFRTGSGKTGGTTRSTRCLFLATP